MTDVWRGDVYLSTIMVHSKYALSFPNHRLSLHHSRTFSPPAPIRQLTGDTSCWFTSLLLLEPKQPAAAAVAACGADLAPLSSKHVDTIESASVITAGLIGVSLPAPATKK